MFAKQSSPIINPRRGDGRSNVGARYMNKRRGVRSTMYRMVTRATTRGQEVQLIRGSEWQTGARLCPTGVPYCITPGIRIAEL